MSRSQNGWPASANKAEIGIVPLVVAGASFPGGIRGGDVETVFRYFAEQYHLRVEPLVAGWCWGYYFKTVTGSPGAGLSNHAGGGAIDCNAPRHPLGKAGTFTAAQVRELRKILGECGGVLRWGGDYSKRKDEMHVEGVGTLAEFAGAAAAIRRRSGQPPTPPRIAPASGSGWPTIRAGSTGAAVGVWQRFLGLHDDETFGPLTAQATERYQRNQGLLADGVVGPATWDRSGLRRR